MYFKLAFNNIKKSLRDYTIYFLTLTFSVCIFYVFNALESQKAMMRVSETTDLMMSNLASIIGYLSVFIAIVLGFLIVYANKFLIKRRKKELGLYMILGMDKGKISFVLLVETFMIGLGSLVSGLVLGIFLSQGLSVFTAKIFGAQMEQFQFVFSQEGLIKSIACFVMIYFIVMLFNVLTLSKCQLIELIYAHKKNEEPKVKHLWLSVILFTLSVICLVLAYIFIIQNGLAALDSYFYSAIGLAFIGTFLFFMSLSGFLLKVMQGWRRVYECELNMFIFRQINSKINTTYVSMTFICLMLAVTIVSLSSGMAVNQSMREELKRLTPYDASFRWEKGIEQQGNIEEQIQKMGIDLKDYAKESMTFSIYETTMAYEMLYEGQAMTNMYSPQLKTEKIEAVAVSDFNQAMELQGKKGITLKEDEFALNCQQSALLETVKTYLKTHETLEYEGRVLKNTLGVPIQETLFVQLSNVANVFLILPDEALNRTKELAIILNMNYQTPEMEAKMMEDIKVKSEELGEYKASEEIYISGLTRELVYDASVGLSAIMTFLTVYIAIVFMMTSAAILALAQLTEAEDNKVRYQLLGKLGADERMIHKALGVQIGIYFAVPLLLAIVHGIVGIYVANRVITIFGQVNVLSSILFTAAMFIVIYGAYFVGTYFNSKNVIK